MNPCRGSFTLHATPCSLHFDPPSPPPPPPQKNETLSLNDNVIVKAEILICFFSGAQKSYLIVKVGDPDNIYQTTLFVSVSDLYKNSVEIPIVIQVRDTTNKTVLTLLTSVTYGWFLIGTPLGIITWVKPCHTYVSL